MTDQEKNQSKEATVLRDDAFRLDPPPCANEVSWVNRTLGGAIGDSRPGLQDTGDLGSPPSSPSGEGA